MYDNKTTRRLDFSSWEQLKSFFYKLSKRPLNEKKDAELFSPAIYETDTTRANKNVLAWSNLAAVDIDDWIDVGSVEERVRDLYNKWSFICYSTASSTTDTPKFRVLFQLDSVIPNDNIKHFWYALQSEIDSVGDKQCKDLSRMYYIPGLYDKANNFIFHNDNTPIDTAALMTKWPYNNKQNSANFLDRLPDEWRKQVIEHRKTSLDNRSYSWTNYNDCPFWPKKLASEYQTISDEGWYRKMYQIMVATAGNAIGKQYPITAREIAELCKGFDIENGMWYENRPLELEADRALEYVYTK